MIVANLRLARHGQRPQNYLYKSSSPHLRLRMKLRGIPKTLPKQIWLEAKERYYDRATQHSIAVMGCRVKERMRELALSYDEKEGVIQLITVHPIKELQKLSRIKIGRWQRL